MGTQFLFLKVLALCVFFKKTLRAIFGTTHTFFEPSQILAARLIWLMLGFSPSTASTAPLSVRVAVAFSGQNLLPSPPTCVSSTTTGGQTKSQVNFAISWRLIFIFYVKNRQKTWSEWSQSIKWKLSFYYKLAKHLCDNDIFKAVFKFLVRGRFGECAFCAFGRFAETVAAQKAVLLPPGPLASRAFCKTAALPEFHLMDRCTGWPCQWKAGSGCLHFPTSVGGTIAPH